MAGCKSAKRVLVGTYRPENESWIRERRLYNLPLSKCVRPVFRESINLLSRVLGK